MPPPRPQSATNVAATKFSRPDLADLARTPSVRCQCGWCHFGYTIISGIDGFVLGCTLISHMDATDTHPIELSLFACSAPCCHLHLLLLVVHVVGPVRIHETMEWLNCVCGFSIQIYHHGCFCSVARRMIYSLATVELPSIQDQICHHIQCINRIFADRSKQPPVKWKTKTH